MIHFSVVTLATLASERFYCSYLRRAGYGSFAEAIHICTCIAINRRGTKPSGKATPVFEFGYCADLMGRVGVCDLP